MNSFQHIPVLGKQVLEAIKPYSGGIYIDGTLGGGGHSSLILEASAPDGILLGIDRDSDALAAAGERLADYGDRFIKAKGNYCDMSALAAAHGISRVDGILLDIGVSSYQLDEASRGFSYMNDALLDMRMDRSQGVTAADIVATYSKEELAHILYTYGEEKWAARIAEFIVEQRQKQPIETTLQLVDVIKKAIPVKAREKDQHPAKRSFQALRIVVNGELDALEKGLDSAIELLKPGGVLAVISFHSLEDRIVKEKFRYHSTDCICPPKQPVCTCGHKADIKLYNRRPIKADDEELSFNHRSRSAVLRAAIKK